MKHEEQAFVCIVTGYSGAGKSTVLKTLEDLGFLCIDNLPGGFVSVLSHVLAHHTTNTNTNTNTNTAQKSKIALGIDSRSGQTRAELGNYIQELKELFVVKIIFLQADTATLLKRFQETRRRHPLAYNQDITDAINHETDLLEPLKSQADYTIATDGLTIHDLRLLVRSILADTQPSMVVSLVSFGFKYGVPAESNFVYDVRSLPNPYFVEQLKYSNGTEKAVQDYLFNCSQVQEYWAYLQPFFLYALTCSLREGRSFVHIALGCTGGRHRSVALIEKLAQLSVDQVCFIVKHRDIKKDLTL